LGGDALIKANKARTLPAWRTKGGVAVTPVSALLTALERHDVATLMDLLDHEGMTTEHFTLDDATTLWDAGWHAWRGEGEEDNASWPAGDERGAECPEPWASDDDAWATPMPRPSPPLWHISLGMFLRVLQAAFPALPGAPAWVALQDVEEE
jgi:hypothetical protein